ncbi:helix-turn-helix domain-containing protein [Ammoniphilus resinae]|uniref:Transcriptional regulator with XRE-family HTH domain n=1 Tax=Ammoniphilus resinae TaxID=861532 RepID=A0ABS4GK62_9BACL|nr:XRE family transcriptional regulator [Ammoniphilus resinae]MBP1930647.1 transcriptional regulator with XRE-family HTH domain [Ammoniphilus resinae]
MELPLERIGGKIRAVRKRQGQTLEALSHSTGLSKGLLSQVERGVSQPSLETLWKITIALDTPIVHFFDDLTDQRVRIIRESERKKIIMPGILGSCEWLGQSSNARLRAMEILLHPGEKVVHNDLPIEGEVCILVKYGQLDVEIGEEHYSVTAGDSLFFDCQYSYLFTNQTNDKATFDIIFTPSHI